MIIFVHTLTGEWHEFEVSPGDTIAHLYKITWKACGYDTAAAKGAAKGDHDGLGLCFAGKRLKHRSYEQVAAENNLSIAILRDYCDALNTLASYNIQAQNRIYLVYYETEARKRLSEECCVCLETLSDCALVGYRQCINKHVIHRMCARDLNACPLCRTSY